MWCRPCARRARRRSTSCRWGRSSSVIAPGARRGAEGSMRAHDGEARPAQSSEPLAVDGVVFDLDGTLVDSCDDIAQAANFSLNAAGFARRSPADIRSFIGDGSRLLLA